MDKSTFLKVTKENGSVKLGKYILWDEHGKVTLDYNYGEEIIPFESLEDEYENGKLGEISIKDYVSGKTLDELFTMVFTTEPMHGFNGSEN